MHSWKFECSKAWFILYAQLAQSFPESRSSPSLRYFVIFWSKGKNRPTVPHKPQNPSDNRPFLQNSPAPQLHLIKFMFFSHPSPSEAYSVCCRSFELWECNYSSASCHRILFQNFLDYLSISLSSWHFYNSDWLNDIYDHTVTNA